MMRKPVWKLVRLGLAAAMIVAATALPAIAVPADTDPVPNAARLYGHDLKGLTYVDARAQLSSEYGKLPVLTVRIGRRDFAFNLRAVVVVDVPTTLAKAYAARPDTSTPYDIQPAYKVDRAKVRAWVIGRARLTDHEACQREVRPVPGLERSQS